MLYNKIITEKNWNNQFVYINIRVHTILRKLIKSADLNCWLNRFKLVGRLRMAIELSAAGVGCTKMYKLIN